MERVLNRRAFMLLAVISVFMTVFIVIWSCRDIAGFADYVGINETMLDIPEAWVVALCTAVGYVAYTACMVPLVRSNIFVFRGLLKWIGIYAALSGGLVEELVFRRMLMDWLYWGECGIVIQIFVSGVAFGLVHLSWSLFGGSWRVGMASFLSTTVLGLLLAVLYIIADRNVLPTVMAHIIINIFVEPWLIMNAVESHGLHDAE